MALHGSGNPADLLVSSATVADQYLTVTMTEDLTGCPTGQAWVVTNRDGSTEGSIQAKCSGRSVKVLLRTSSQGLALASHFNYVSLGYVKGQASDHLGGSKFSIDGIEVDSFSGVPVSNQWPLVAGAAVNGNVLTLTYDQDLDESSVPSGDAFSVRAEHRGGEGIPVCRACRLQVTDVSVSGRTVTLTLEHPIPHGARVTVKYGTFEYRRNHPDGAFHYTVPSSNPLQNPAGHDARAFGHNAWNTIAVEVQTPDTPPVFSSAGIELRNKHSNEPETWLVMRFNDDLDKSQRPDASAFTVTAGRAVATTGDLTVGDYGKVGVRLSQEIPAGRDVTLSYAKPSANGLRDLASNLLESFSGKPVNNGQPRVISTVVSSDPGDDRIYERGEKVLVQVTFSYPVIVNGSPRLKLSLGRTGSVLGASKWAHYERGSGTTTLAFAYTVGAGDYSGTQGISVQANSLQLNGGKIASTWDSGDVADLSGQTGTPFGRNHRVDGRADETVWTATLDPKKFGNPNKNSGNHYFIGCNYEGDSACWQEGRLEPETAFTHAGTRYSFFDVYNHQSWNGAWNLTMRLDRGVPRNWNLHVDGTVFCVDNGDVSSSGRNVAWDFSGDLDWAEGTGVALKLTAPPAGSPWTCGGSGGHALPTVPLFQSATVDGTALTLTFNQDLRTASTPAPGAFYVTVNDAQRNVASDGVAIDGATVTLTLASGVSASETVKVRYTKPSSNPLQGAYGDAVETFADRAVTNNTTDPRLVSNLGQTSRSGASNNLDFAQQFRVGPHSDGYTLTGVTLKLLITTATAPTYTVSINRNATSDYPADTMVGTLTNPPSLPTDTTSGLTADQIRDRLVEVHFKAPEGGISLEANTFYHVVFNVTAPNNAQWYVGETSVDDDDPGSATGWWIRDGSNWRLHDATNFVPLSQRSQESRQIAVHGRLSGTSVGGAVGNSGQTIPPIDPVADPSTQTGPTVTGVSVTSGAGADQTYGLGDTIQVTLTFSEAVDVTGTPRLKIDMDPADWGEKWAAYDSGSGTATLTFTHTVVEPNISTQGIAVLANTLELNGGDIELKDTDNDADLSHDGLAHDSNHKVDWQTAGEEGGGGGTEGQDGSDNAPPSVSGVAVSSSPQANATYALGETIQVTLTFDEAVDVTGTPRLKIDMDPAEWGEKWAAYQGGSGSTTLTFTHTVVEPNISTQGIAVLEDTLELNGGTIRSDDTDADLDHDGLAHDAKHKVDWEQSDSESPANSAATGAPAITGTARVGETLTADTSGIADADGLTGASFSYQWLADNSDISGATGSTYAPASADVGKAVKVRVSFTDDAGHAETLTSSATAAVAASPPEVTAVAVTSNPGSGDTYGPGEVIRISVTFDEAVDVTGTPQLTIDMDPAEWGAKQAAYESGSGTTTLVFAHTVVEPNISTQGIAVLANTLALNGGDIESKATDTDADLSHTGLAHDSDHKVNWRLGAPTVTGVAVTSNPGSGDTYGLGEVIRISVTFDEAVDVTGAPQLTIDMDPAEWGAKQAAYESGSGTTTLVFAHTVVEPNISTQGIAVLANTLALNGGDIESKATDTDADLSHTGLAHDASHKVDWQQEGEGPGS